jgi:hypothetical protein
MEVHQSEDRVESPESAPPVSGRRKWTAPAIEALPKLTDLTLLSPIGGGGGIGGSTVFGLLLAAGLLFGVSACSDTVLPSDRVSTRPLVSSQALTCRADVRAGSVTCAAPERSPGTVITGGQGTKVGLRSSNASYNNTSFVFSVDVSVQNESALPMGTQDGTTKDSAGIKVFFLSAPTGDAGVVAVGNPTGLETFTAPVQPYFKYDTLLTSQQVSNSQTWQFQLAPTTTSFTFQVLVSTAMPARGTILRWAEEPGVNGANWQGISGWGSDGLAVFGQYGEVYVRDSGVWHTYSDPLGSGPGGASPNNQVVAAGRNDFTFNNGSRFRHWDGISWRSLDSLPNSPGLMYAIGPTGGLGGIWGMGFRFARFSGASWISDTLPTGVNKAVASTTFGMDPVIFTDQGRVWQQSSSTGIWTQIGGAGGSGQTQGPGIIFGTGASDLWTLSIANNTDPTVRYWNGSSWATQANPSGQDNNTGIPLGGVAYSSSDAFIVRTDNNGHGHIWHFDGSNWTDVHTAAYNYNGIWSRGTDDFFVAEAGGRVEEYNSGTWSFVLDSASTADAAWVGSSGNAYVGTNVGTVLHYDGTGWTTTASIGGSITSLWGSGASDVWAARTSNSVWHYDGGGWSSAAIGSSGWPAIGMGGSGPHDVWAVGALSQILHYDGTSWSVVKDLEVLFPYDLYAVWAPNDTFAVAVGQAGDIGMFQGGSWSAATSPTSLALRAVSGTSGSDVWAVGDGGVIAHYNGTSWSTVSSGTGQNLLGVWASSPNEAYAVGANKTVLMYNGSSWRPISVQSSAAGSYNAISGVHGGQALIVGDRVLRGTR